MEKYRRQKMIIIIALIITIAGLSIGFAAFSEIFKISSTASVTPNASTFSVKFSTKQDSLDESAVTASNKTTGVESTDGVINNSSSPTISNLSATFTTPGQYVEYTFYARNEGEYKAYLNNVNFVGTKTCTGGSDATDSLVQSACDSINITVTVGDSTYSQTTAISGHALEKNTGEKIVVNLSYASDGTRADGEFSVNFGKITMVYSSIDDSSFVPPATSVADNVNTINYRMKNLAQSDASTDFNATPVAGVYVVSDTANDTNPIYYYRGAVTNNNVLFANLCWKVVRTTETGGVKLIYNGTPTGTQCNGTSQTIGTSVFNTADTTAADVRYIYEDGTDSTIKGVIDKWYASNMVAYTEKLEDEGWCSDLSEFDPVDLGENGLPANSIVYGAYKRIIEGSPSVLCSTQYQMTTTSTIVGNKLKYPVALLTADEVMMAGTGAYGTEGYTEDAYLNIGEGWWSLSPLGFYIGYAAYLYRIQEYGRLGTATASYESGIRPSISLAPNTEISSGDGTSSTPYIID